MFLLGSHHRSSSPISMAVDQANEWDNGPRKRKRDSEQADESFGHPLSMLAQAPFIHGLPTPPHSSFSTLPDLQAMATEVSSPAPSPRTISSRLDEPVSKRPHLIPKARRPRLGMASLSSYSVDTMSAASAAAPCHHCHRQPATLADLSAFTTCEVCNQSTCFVCIRQCEGQRCQAGGADEQGSGFGRRVCASCCVEVGIGGRVWCLPCYHDHDDDADERGLYMYGKNKKELQTERVGMVAAWLDQCGQE